MHPQTHARRNLPNYLTSIADIRCAFHRRRCKQDTVAIQTPYLRSHRLANTQGRPIAKLSAQLSGRAAHLEVGGRFFSCMCIQITVLQSSLDTPIKV